MVSVYNANIPILSNSNILKCFVLCDSILIDLYSLAL